MGMDFIQCSDKLHKSQKFLVCFSLKRPKVSNLLYRYRNSVKPNTIQRTV